MLRDSVRTMSYAKFILSNPEVFRGKLVMDVGCGELSLRIQLWVALDMH